MRRLQATPKGQNRPEAVIQVSCRERPLPDRKADIAYEEIIVRRSNRFARPLSQGQADVGRIAPPSRLVARCGHSQIEDSALRRSRTPAQNRGPRPDYQTVPV